MLQRNIPPFFQLMVAEKSGMIRIYDLTRRQAILSLESLQMPLMSADWCLQNTFRVGAVAANDWLIWEMPQSRLVLLSYTYIQPHYVESSILKCRLYIYIIYLMAFLAISLHASLQLQSLFFLLNVLKGPQL